jgi:hypothetical protein
MILSGNSTHRIANALLMALYPEGGVHLWFSDSVRLTGSLRYYITSRGRDGDRLMYVISVAFRY